jgi:hypothetical protein
MQIYTRIACIKCEYFQIIIVRLSYPVSAPADCRNDRGFAAPCAPTLCELRKMFHVEHFAVAVQRHIIRHCRGIRNYETRTRGEIAGGDANRPVPAMAPRHANGWNRNHGRIAIRPYGNPFQIWRGAGRNQPLPTNLSCTPFGDCAQMFHIEHCEKEFYKNRCSAFLFSKINV